MRWATLIILGLIFSAPAFAKPTPKEIETCPTLDACMTLLDRMAPEFEDGHIYTDSSIAAAHFKSFPDAKQTLLNRATSKDKGISGPAGDILAEWHDWSEADLPQLEKAITAYPGSMIAHAIGEIGTPKAIQILVDNLKLTLSAMNQTGAALERLGPKVLPFLLPLLAGDDRTWEPAAYIITEIGKPAAVYAPAWAKLVLDDNVDWRTRRAALRGLAAMHQYAKAEGPRLRVLLTQGPQGFPSIAFETLKALKDPIVLSRMVVGCAPDPNPLNQGWSRDNQCRLGDIAAFGPAARPYESLFLTFLNSANTEDQIAGMYALTTARIASAIPLIEQRLEAADWRVAYEAVADLNDFGSVASEPKVRQLAQHHWLPELKAFATAVADGLKSPAGRYAPPPPNDNRLPDIVEGMQHSAHFEEVKCASKRWTWNAQSFTGPDPDGYSSSPSRKMGGGLLYGTYWGEWGGGLYWQVDGVIVQEIIDKAPSGIEPIDANHAVVLFGLWTYLEDGYAALATKDEGGFWRLTPIAQMPVDGRMLRRLGPDLFAAWSGGRVVVFATKGILGLADCAA
jgi:hypothetical protein